MVRDDVPVPSSILERKPGAAESAVLAYALTEPDCEAIVDDLAARRAATALGILFRRTLGVILTAKQKGLISSAAQLFDLVQNAGLYIVPGLRAQALPLVGK